MTNETKEQVAVGYGRRFHSIDPKWTRMKRSRCGLYFDATMERGDAAAFLLPCARCYPKPTPEE